MRRASSFHRSMLKPAGGSVFGSTNGAVAAVTTRSGRSRGVAVDAASAGGKAWQIVASAKPTVRFLYKETEVCPLCGFRLQAARANSRLEQFKVTLCLVCIRLRVFCQGAVKLVG